MADNAGLSAALDGIPMVADAAAREARFPLATRKQNQRVFRLDTTEMERWSGSSWISDPISGPLYDDGGAVLNVRHPTFGATGDGVTDDAAAFRAAMAAATAGATVYVPPGTYKVLSQVAFTNSDVALQFAAGASIAATVPAGDVAVFYAAGKSNVRVIGGTITGTFPWGVYLSGGSGHQVAGNTISGGTVPASGKCGGIYLEDCSAFRIHGNICSGNGAAGLDSGADIMGNNGDTSVVDGWITDNQCSSTAVCFNIITFNPRRVKFRGNTCTGARMSASSAGIGGYGIALYRTAGMSAADVSACVITGNLVHDVQGIGIYSQAIDRTIIAENDVLNACTVMQEISLSAAGIVSESLYGKVLGNTVKGSGKNGIIISGVVGKCEGQLVSQNTVVAPALDGIVIAGPRTDVVIAGNHVQDLGTARLAYGALHGTDAAMARCVIKNNTGLNVGLGAWFTASSDRCVIEGNTFTNIHDTGYIAKNDGTHALTRNNTASDDASGPVIQVPEGMSADRGDASVTLVASVDFEVQRFATTLTANRTVTLSATNARSGARFRVVRTGLGAFTLDVGGLKTIPSATAAYVEVVHDGTAWRLAGYGAL